MCRINDAAEGQWWRKQSGREEKAFPFFQERARRTLSMLAGTMSMAGMLAPTGASSCIRGIVVPYVSEEAV